MLVRLPLFELAREKETDALAVKRKALQELMVPRSKQTWPSLGFIKSQTVSQGSRGLKLSDTSSKRGILSRRCDQGDQLMELSSNNLYRPLQRGKNSTEIRGTDREGYMNFETM